MFLFESIPWYSAVMWCVVLAALIGLNEVTRRWRRRAGVLRRPAGGADDLRLAAHRRGGVEHRHLVPLGEGVLGARGLPGLHGPAVPPEDRRQALALVFPPAAILAINIAEAVLRDFQVAGMSEGMVDGVYMVPPGPWNVMNGVAGILNLVTICGWAGIQISRSKSKDMIWPDMLWFWIIPYDLWNFAYVYNCVGDHAFYAGAALLISCTIPAFASSGAPGCSTARTRSRSG